MKYITIIPARGGSKRFPGKNTHILGIQPLICHSIDYSLRNPNIQGTWVSTDADDIMNISQMAGAEIINRPAPSAGGGGHRGDVGRLGRPLQAHLRNMSTKEPSAIKIGVYHFWQRDKINI